MRGIVFISFPPGNLYDTWCRFLSKNVKILSITISCVTWRDYCGFVEVVHPWISFSYVQRIWNSQLEPEANQSTQDCTGFWKMQCCTQSNSLRKISYQLGFYSRSWNLASTLLQVSHHLQFPHLVAFGFQIHAPVLHHTLILSSVEILLFFKFHKTRNERNPRHFSFKPWPYL